MPESLIAYGKFLSYKFHSYPGSTVPVFFNHQTKIMNIENQIQEMWQAIEDSREFCSESDYNAAYIEALNLEKRLRRHDAANKFAAAINSMSKPDRIIVLKDFLDQIEFAGNSYLHHEILKLAEAKVIGGEF